MLNYYLQSPLYILVSSFICGMLIGIWYNIFSIAKILKRLPFFLIFILDIIFSVTASIIIFMFTYSINDGVFRTYEAFGLIIGFLAYHLTVEKIVSFIFFKIISVIKKILVFFYKKTVINTYVLLDKLNKKCKILLEEIFKKSYQKRLFKNFLKISNSERKNA